MADPRSVRVSLGVLCARMQDGQQERLLSLLDAGATLASATGAAGSGAAGLAGGTEGVRRAAAAAAGRPEQHFILSIAACKVHEERPDPRAATATLDQQRRAPLSILGGNGVARGELKKTMLANVRSITSCCWQDSARHSSCQGKAHFSSAQPSSWDVLLPSYP